MELCFCFRYLLGTLWAVHVICLNSVAATLCSHNFGHAHVQTQHKIEMDHRDQNPGAIPPPLPGMVPPGVQMIQVGSPPPQGYPPQGKYAFEPVI